MKFLRNLFNKLRQPSSMAGVSVLLGIFGVQVAPDTMTTVVNAVAGAAALGAMLIDENTAN